MLYSLKQGPTEQLILKQCLRERLAIPEAIKNAPDLWMGLELYYTAFWDLDTCRMRGFDQGPITWFDVRRYCQDIELDDIQTEKMHLVIPMMDREYLSFVAGKRKQKTKVKDG